MLGVTIRPLANAASSQTRFAFDLDGTLTRREILLEIARSLLTGSKLERFEALVLQGQQNPNAYIPNLARRIELLGELPTRSIHEVVAKIPIHETLCSWIREHRTQCLVVTHNIPTWVAPLTDTLGCRVVGSSPRWDNGRVVGLSQATHKADEIASLVEQGHCVVTIGDGINDIPMFRASHWGIAWSGSHPAAPDLIKVAQACIDDPDVLCQMLKELRQRPAQAFLGPALSGVYQAIASRRDIRRFQPNRSIADGTLNRLRQAFYQGPNVGLMQPARVIEIESPQLRKSLHAIVEQERQATAHCYEKQEGSERAQAFLSLKVEGILDCAKLWVVALRDDRKRELFGRRTLPHMDLASASCAIQNLWLAARAEGLGLGWVSLFSPQAVRELLHLPQDADPIAILCIGPAVEFLAQPRLVHDGWRAPKPQEQLFYRDHWPKHDTTSPATTPPRRCELVLGGQRSGKSRYAETQSIDSGLELHYIATCTVLDQEMQSRIAVHQARRDTRWTTHEVPLELATALKSLAAPNRCLLVDCLTVWLSNCLHHEVWETQRNELLAVLDQLPGSIYLVGNLVGQGVIPMNALSRAFVDHSGLLYQDLARTCTHVTQVTAGLAQSLQRNSPNQRAQV